MTTRERFLKIMRYETVDALPLFTVDPWERDTLKNWRTQGLPENQQPEEFLQMGARHILPVFFMPYPPFGRKILSEDDTYRIELSDMGATVKRRKDFPSMYYGYTDFPVKTAGDWQEYKKRFSPGEYRYGDDLEDMAEEARLSENPVCLMLYPFFMRLGFYSMGFERFLTAFYDEPEFMHGMFDFWSAFVAATIQPVLEKIKPDFVTIEEDLAFKNGPHMSPAIYKEFWIPYQNRVIDLVQKACVPHICMYTSGDCRALLPLMMENGINMTCTVDRNSNMDPIALRKEFGRGLTMLGGVGKHTLMAGEYAIDKELERLMPLMEEGGFIPACDDMIPPEVPFANYCYFINKCREIKF